MAPRSLQGRAWVGSRKPRIEERGSTALEVSDIAGGDGETVNESGRRDEAVDHRTILRDAEPTPPLCNALVHRKDAINEVGAEHLQPCIEGVGLDRIPRAQPLDSFSDLPERENAQMELLVLNRTRPQGNVRITTTPEFGDDIGVKQEAQAPRPSRCPWNDRGRAGQNPELTG